jgi:hypothetical protein
LLRTAPGGTPIESIFAYLASTATSTGGAAVTEAADADGGAPEAGHAGGGSASVQVDDADAAALGDGGVSLASDVSSTDRALAVPFSGGAADTGALLTVALRCALNTSGRAGGAVVA